MYIDVFCARSSATCADLHAYFHRYMQIETTPNRKLITDELNSDSSSHMSACTFGIDPIDSITRLSLNVKDFTIQEMNQPFNRQLNPAFTKLKQLTLKHGNPNPMKCARPQWLIMTIKSDDVVLEPINVHVHSVI
ncbi:hypothetical protein BLOT_012755 [Blomia tropicalis]|nr:hypothetical protein BLOT_012755 [Blomia tropicalis]